MKFREFSVGIFALLLVGCGGGANSTAPAPTGPGAGTSPVIGGNLEDASPGTPISQVANRQQLLTTMRQNLSACGTSSVSSQIQFNYQLDYTNAQAPLKRLDQGASSAFSGNVRVCGQVYGSQLYVQTYTQTEGWMTFSYVAQVNVYGARLYTTDSVALFLSSDNNSLLKVAYTTQNPTIQYFNLQFINNRNIGSYNYGYGQPQTFRVITRSLVTTFQYPQAPANPTPTNPGNGGNYTPPDYYLDI